MNPAAGPLLELREIHAAPPPGLWPPAPGWWALAILLGVLLALGILWLRRRYQARRFRHEVMLELEQITDRYKNNYAGLVGEAGIWLRRVALLRYPQEEVACAGQVLETGPYRQRVQGEAVDALLALARRWGKKNLEAGA